MKLPTRITTRAVAFVLAIALGAAAVAGLSASRTTTPSDTESNITRLTVSILARSQFAHHPLDADLANQFLERYLDALDGRRSLFLQSDIDDFGVYRGALAEATRQGKTTAAHVIRQRYLQRLRERTAYLERLLQAEDFDFTGQDTYSFDWEHAQRPRDMPAAQAEWGRQLRAEYLEEKLREGRTQPIAVTLNRRYAQQLRAIETQSSDEVLEIYLNALAHVYDPHSDYLGRGQMESLAIQMNLSLFGIGAALETVDGYCTIREVLPGGPAARGGVLKPGDRIVSVAQGDGAEAVDIMDLPLSRAVDLIRGPKGSTVILTIIAAGALESSQRQTVALVRDEIQLEAQQAKARIVDLPDGERPPLRLGVIELRSFYADLDARQGGGQRSATADVARLLTKLNAQGVQGLIVDLRGNGGGSLAEAVSLTGLFIPEGPVVQTRGPDGGVEVEADKDPTELYAGPLIVLTNRFSASASEILAGALDDYGRAVIVGDTSTFGKGTVQSILPLARAMDQSGLSHAYDPGALKVTIRKFYRPSGASTQLRGVASAIVLPSLTDFSAISESTLENPLPWDTVPSAAYLRVDRAAPYIDILRERSFKRIAADVDFVDQAEDIAQLRASLAEKTISLNEADRRGELASARQRRIAREQQRAERRSPRPTTYLITLGNVDAPGLPEPTVTADGSGASGAKAPGIPQHDAKRSGSQEDLLLDETLRILADYVDLDHARARSPTVAR
jgi:carboxyl-terminal processing protease